MTDMTPFEDEVRRSLQSAADAVVVNDNAFDPGRPLEIELDELPVRPARRVERILLVAAAVVMVLVAAAIVVHETGGSNGGARVGDTSTSAATATTVAATVPPTAPVISIPGPPSAALIAKLAESEPNTSFEAIGAGTNDALPVAGSGPVLTANGKPRVVWIGAEYCPFCAAQRWPLVIALARFGTFSGLGLITSAATTPDGQAETDPDTPSFTFHGSTYSSPYLTFDAVEEQDRAYNPLDTPTAEEQALVSTFDTPPYTVAAGSIPFVDFANQYLSIGATFSPTLLAGKTAEEIATSLSEPKNEIAQAVVGSANVTTAALCTLTANQPASVCSDPMIKAIQSRLPSGS